MAKKRVHKEDFSKLSTGKFPVFTDPVEFVNQSGPVGPVPVYQIGSSSVSYRSCVPIGTLLIILQACKWVNAVIYL
jgi:hypothetical protein